MGDHTCTPISSEESSNIIKLKSVMLSANVKSTRSICTQTIEAAAMQPLGQARATRG